MAMLSFDAMYSPDFNTFKTLSRRGNLIPVYREILADLETPVSAYQKIAAGSKYSFLLESVEGEEKIGRYSFLGADPTIVFRSKGKVGEILISGKDNKSSHGRRAPNILRFALPSGPLPKLKQLIKQYRPVSIKGLPRFFGGAVGYLGYENVNFFEKLPQNKPDELKIPDCYFLLTDTILVFDRVKHTIKVVSNAHVPNRAAAKKAYAEAVRKIEAIVKKLAKPAKVRPIEAEETPGIKPSVFRSNFTKKGFEKAVAKAKQYILAGDIFQVVPSQRFSTRIKTDPFSVYRALRVINPSPYLFFLRFDDLALAGSSPEIMLRVEGQTAILRPIAGTRPRGADEAQDKKLVSDLLADAKEKAEHIMLVDLGRNDLGRVCHPGTVKVDELMTVEKYSHVMHIVSNVTGQLKPGCDSFDALKASFPAGTVSGAPKVRAMEIINELEPSQRGLYAGAVGYFSFSGNLDSAIAIRTIVLKGRTAYVQAGGGVVADSRPANEYQESCNKAKALLKAVEMAERGLR